MARKKRKKKSGINIKKSRKGLFTSFCRRKGYSGVTNACIAEGLKSSDPKIRRRANFARNSRKWRKKR